MLALTLGAGVRNPKGQRVDLPLPEALPAILEGHRPGRPEAWWSTHVWQDGHRSADRWIGTSGVMVDIDYHDGEGHHTAPPAAHAAALEQAARSGRLPGSLFHGTPRGARIIFLFGELERDKDLFAAAARGAGALVNHALTAIGLSGYQVDPAVLQDLARLLYAPHAVVDGTARVAEVITIQQAPSDPRVLAQLAPTPEPQQLQSPHRPQQGRAAEDFAGAVRDYNSRNAREWPRNSARCPACGDSASFGQLPSDHTRWHCFSSDHTAPGLKGALGYHGDVLDLDAHEAGATRRDFLMRHGYWRVAVQAAPQPAPAPPPAEPPEHVRDNVIPIRPETIRSIGKTFASLCEIIRSDRRVTPDAPRWNEMLLAPTIAGTSVDDAMISAIRERIELVVQDSKGKGLKFGGPDINDAIDLVAHENSYHPVEEYLAELEWDGTPRIAYILEDILDAPVTELNQALIRRWLISAVARVLRPGCQADSTLILQGAQGAGKSSFFRILARGEWFSDSPIDMRNKDAAMALRRIWILELAELAAIQRQRDIETVKGFLTTRVDNYRPPYGKRIVDVPRRCVFGGSTNEDEILSDPTGNRRFWVLPVGQEVNREGLESQRDQIWAEAVYAFHEGERWHLDETESEQLRAAQAPFEKTDEWGELILKFATEQLVPFTVLDVLEGPLQVHRSMVNRGMEMRVAATLRRAGFRRQKLTGADGRAWRWSR